jgi:hypothetical protein
MESIQRNRYDEIILSKIKSGEISVDVENGVIFSNKKDAIGRSIALGWEQDGNFIFGFKHDQQRHFYVCRAVWLAKHGFVEHGKEVSHKDGNKKNNKIDNLILSEPKKKFNPKSWKPAELKWLEKNKKHLSLPQLASHLGRSIKSVRHKIKNMGLLPKSKPLHFWSEKDDRDLIEAYRQKMTVEDVAKKFGRSVNSVRLRANKFGAFRSDKHLSLKLQESKNFYLALKQTLARGTTGAKCCLCDYSKHVELHHIKQDLKLNGVGNIASLCPTHHTEVTHGEHDDKNLYCIWWRIYSDGTFSEVFDNQAYIIA